jgi:hypothetical protein
MKKSAAWPTMMLMLALLPLGCGMIDHMTGISDVKELQQTGAVAEAVILQVWDTGITLNQDPVIGLRVRVQPKDAAPYEATIKKSVISRIDLPQFQPGSVIPIRIDPKDPNHVAIDVYKYH